MPIPNRSLPGLPGVLVALLLLMPVPRALQAQALPDAPAPDPSRSGALFDGLARMDSLLFDASFVSCDHSVVDAIFADDLEFYHDQTGFHSSEQARENTRKLTESCPHDRGISRTLVPGSLQVFPIAQYGAVQTGVHRFVERGAPRGTIAKFVHLWQLQEGTWRLTRVLSFDHRPESAEADAAGHP